MRKTLEDLYYGNITPNEQRMTPDSELEKAVARVTKYENQLMEQLEEIDQETLTKLIRSQHEINSITATENFILGFRLGVRLMAECMDESQRGQLLRASPVGALHWTAAGRDMRPPMG